MYLILKNALSIAKVLEKSFFKCMQANLFTFFQIL